MAAVTWCVTLKQEVRKAEGKRCMPAKCSPFHQEDDNLSRSYTVLKADFVVLFRYGEGNQSGDDCH